jgi:hypothetical protein
MRIFGMGKNDFPELPVSKPKDPILSKQSYFDEVIMPMIKVKEEGVLSRQPALLEKYIEDHKKRVEGYDFSCVRHGDFLTVFMTQSANADLPDPIDTKFTTTINLRGVRTISKVEGKAPGLHDHAKYLLNMCSETDPSSSTIWSSGDVGFFRPPEGYKHCVQTLSDFEWHRPDHTWFASEDSTNKRYAGFDNYNTNAISYSTPGVASPAVNDRIVFSNINIVIYAPFGKGSEVEAKILEALEKGYTPKDLPKVNSNSI